MKTVREGSFPAAIVLLLFATSGLFAQKGFTVTYVGNGNTLGSVPVDRILYAPGQSVTAQGNTGKLARTGYDFSGWNTAADGSGKDAAPGSTFRMPAANVTLYVKWVASRVSPAPGPGKPPAIAAKLPDLVVESIVVNPISPMEKGDITILVSVRNVGPVPAVFPKKAVMLNGGDYGRYVSAQQDDSIAAGQSRTFSFAKAAVAAGIHTITFTVNPEGKLAEANMSNNQRSISVKVRADTTPRPDFVVTGVTFTPANPTTSDRVMINVAMKNQGAAAGTIPAGALTWSEKVTGKPGSGGSSDGQVIQPGGTFSGGVFMVEPGDWAAGTYQVVATVDPQDRCLESNESNNSLTVNLAIGSGSTATIQKADMVIMEMVLEPPQVTIQTDFRVKVTVKNQGNVAATFPNGSLILGGPDLYYQYADQGGTSFQPGESRTYRLVKGNVQAGSFT
ncbi:MAG: InlB B-repeat-containing protein, partial [Spirochaetes bacterium]|nr:InlB B-repeat-containing protein [Spirochaetota bacterium]